MSWDFCGSSDGGGGEITPEQLARLSRIGIPLRIEGSTTILSSGHLGYTNSGIEIDAFPDAGGLAIDVNLPPSTDDYFSVEVFNQSASDIDVNLNNNAGSLILPIPPVNAYKAFYDSEQSPSVAPWELIQTEGNPVPVLSTASYGDFLSLNHLSLKVKQWEMVGPGTEFTRLPTGITLNPAATYKFGISQVSITGTFQQTVIMSSADDPNNVSNGRLYVRSGADLASPWYEHALTSDLYPPQNTGQNASGTGVVVYTGNTTDSVASADLSAFVIAKQNSNGAFPNPIYDVGRLSLDSAEVKLTNISGTNYSFIINASGKLTSDSTANNAVIGIRINSTGGVGTGTSKTYSAGTTQGAATVRAGYTTIGAFTLAPTESVWIEVSKSVAGTLVFDESLLIIEPIW